MDNIYIPSYKRWERVRTYEYLGTGHIVVPESQEHHYKQRYGKAVVSIPDHQDGSISKKRNAVLDMIAEREQDGYGWICDDDLIHLVRKKENIKLSGDECLEHFERLYIMAKDMQASLAGFEYSADNMKLKDMAPFSLTKPMFQIVLINVHDKIRYDERLRVAEDYEIFVHKMAVNRRVLKDNQYYTHFYGKEGGDNSTIGYDRAEQRKYATLINNKWGIKTMVWNGKTRFDYKLPIKGV